MSLRTALPPLLSVFAVVVCAHAGAIETRAATSQERLSLAAYQRAPHPDAAPEQPVLAVFDIARQPRGRGWRVAAHVDAAPTRSSPALCRMIRSRYDYRADAPKDQRWSARTPDQQFVWLSRGAACDAASAPTPAIELNQPLPDADIVSLLQLHAALMQRARLLLAGNTQCARSRSAPPRRACSASPTRATAPARRWSRCARAAPNSAPGTSAARRTEGAAGQRTLTGPVIRGTIVRLSN